MRWRRTPFGYVSSDLQWFLERGGRMTHGANAWLVWRRATEVDVSPDSKDSVGGPFGHHNEPIKTFKEVSGAIEGDILFIDTLTEGGWLSEAKAIVEILQKEAS